MKKLSLFIGICAFLISCDPGKRITIRNKTKSDVRINFSKQNWITPDSQEFYLGNTGNTKMTLSYGLGNWQENEIDTVWGQIDFVSIFTEKDTILLSQKEDFVNLISIKRKGLLNENLSIKIKD